MKDRIDELLGRIRALQDELDGEYRRAREDWARKRADLADELVRQQRRYKTGLLRYLLRSRALVILTAPVIYIGWVPFALMDLFVTLYQWICFPVYRIPRVRRSDYVVFDRAELPYLNLIEKFNAAGSQITAQVFARPIGLVIGLELTANPFALYPSYQEIADLPLAQRVAEMRKPEVRERILADKPGEGHPFMYFAQAWQWMFPMTEPANYEPSADQSILARAAARGVSPLEEAYDRLLDDDGHAMMLVALANFENNSLDTVGELMRRDDVVLGLGDGGAHYGMICDGSYPTFVLAHWARDRASGRLSVGEAVRQMTSVPAAVAGLEDRGRIAVGYKADLNVIDHAGLTLHKPTIVHDLPGGGRRLDQAADGYVATIVSGEVIAENGVPTPARPGKLIRGKRPAPAG